jgi:hypothetical protein
MTEDSNIAALNDQISDQRIAELDQEISKYESRLGKGGDEARDAERAKEVARDEQRRSEMGQVFDRLQAETSKRSHAEAILKPAEPTETNGAQLKGATLRETFERRYDFLKMPPEERALKAVVRNEVDAVKAFAKEHGISPEQAEAMRQTAFGQQKAAPQIPPELHSSIESVRQIYPNQPFHEVANRYVEIDRLVKSDPVQGVAWIAEQFGMNPLQLAQALAMRFGDQTAIMSNATRLVDDFFVNNPEAAALEDGMLKAIESGAVKRTGSIANDLQAALSHAKRETSKVTRAKKTGSHLKASFREAYDRAEQMSASLNSARFAFAKPF